MDNGLEFPLSIHAAVNCLRMQYFTPILFLFHLYYKSSHRPA